MYPFKIEGLVSEPIDDVAQSLPGQHFDENIRQIIGHLHVGV
jgi:hypothetical protein